MGRVYYWGGSRWFLFGYVYIDYIGIIYLNVVVIGKYYNIMILILERIYGVNNVFVDICYFLVYWFKRCSSCLCIVIIIWNKLIYVSVVKDVWNIVWIYV